MSKLGLSRRTFVQGSVGLAVANFVRGTTPLAFAATMEEQTVAAAKTVGKADVSGMIWSPYFVPMQPVIAEFTKQTGIGIGGIQDISISMRRSARWRKRCRVRRSSTLSTSTRT